MGVKVSSSHTPDGEISSSAELQVPDDLERPGYLIKNEPAGNKAPTQPSPPRPCLSFINYAAASLDCVHLFHREGHWDGDPVRPSTPADSEMRRGDGQSKARWATRSSGTNLGPR